MKRIVAFALAALLVFALAACGGNATSNAGTPAANAGQGKIVYIIMNLGDMSFNDSGQAGMTELESLGWETDTSEAGEDVSRYESYIREACEDDTVKYIVAPNNFQEQMEAAAAQFPDKRFVIFDVAADTPVAHDNILYVVYGQNEGSFLVGAIAASMSESGVIGAVGGVENPVIQDFMTGYIAGAQHINPDIKVATGWVGSWTDTDLMYNLVEQQHTALGVDMLFPIAGGAGDGAFDYAAQNDGLWIIGVDSDQHEGYMSRGDETKANTILTSMVKDVGASFVSIFSDVAAGNEYWGTVRTIGVAEGGVTYANNSYFQANAPADVQTMVAGLRDDIAAGTITVPGFADFEDGKAGFDALVASVAP